MVRLRVDSTRAATSLTVRCLSLPFSRSRSLTRGNHISQDISLDNTLSLHTLSLNFPHHTSLQTRAQHTLPSHNPKPLHNLTQPQQLIIIAPPHLIRHTFHSASSSFSSPRHPATHAPTYRHTHQQTEHNTILSPTLHTPLPLDKIFGILMNY